MGPYCIRQAQEVGGGPYQPEGGQREKRVAGVPRKQSEVNDTFVFIRLLLNSNDYGASEQKDDSTDGAGEL